MVIKAPQKQGTDAVFGKTLERSNNIPKTWSIVRGWHENALIDKCLFTSLISVCSTSMVVLGDGKTHTQKNIVSYQGEQVSLEKWATLGRSSIGTTAKKGSRVDERPGSDSWRENIFSQK